MDLGRTLGGPDRTLSSFQAEQDSESSTQEAHSSRRVYLRKLMLAGIDGNRVRVACPPNRGLQRRNSRI